MNKNNNELFEACCELQEQKIANDIWKFGLKQTLRPYIEAYVKENILKNHRNPEQEDNNKRRKLDLKTNIENKVNGKEKITVEKKDNNDSDDINISFHHKKEFESISSFNSSIIEDSNNDNNRNKEKNKNNKKIKRRDPNAPKKAKPAYIIFASEKMKEGKKMPEISDLWKNITDEEKKKYEEMYEKDRQRYKEEMENYNKYKEIEPNA